MLKKLVQLLRPRPQAPDLPLGKYADPYGKSGLTPIYQLLFCDDLNLYRPKPGAAANPALDLLFKDQPDPVSVRALSNDPQQASRIRMLACNWLRERGERISQKELFGVILELPLEHGVETLAVYSDRTIRYFTQGGRLAIYDALPGDIGPQVGTLLTASQEAITRIGPWNKERLAPPATGSMRLTFLVSDGLYFGQGPYPGMDQDPTAGPVITEFAKLPRMLMNFLIEGDKQASKLRPG